MNKKKRKIHKNGVGAVLMNGAADKTIVAAGIKGEVYGVNGVSYDS